MNEKFEPDELLESLGGGSQSVNACTWGSLGDLYHQVYARVRAEQPVEHIAGALDISEAMTRQIGDLVRRWYEGDAEHRPVQRGLDDDPIEFLASVSSLLYGRDGVITSEDVTLLKSLLARAKAKGLDWARIYTVAASVRREGSPPAPPVEDVRPR